MHPDSLVQELHLALVYTAQRISLRPAAHTPSSPSTLQHKLSLARGFHPTSSPDLLTRSLPPKKLPSLHAGIVHGSENMPSGCGQSWKYSPSCAPHPGTLARCLHRRHAKALMGLVPARMKLHYLAHAGHAGSIRYPGRVYASSILAHPSSHKMRMRHVLWRLMRTSQGLGVLRPSQDPHGPLPTAQPRVADRSHAHIMPAPARL